MNDLTQLAEDQRAATAEMPATTTLRIDFPDQLLRDLQGTVDPADLLAVDGIRNPPNPGWYRSVHAHVLGAFMTAFSYEEAQVYFQCCERLIELHAPITDIWGPGAAAQFAGYPWPQDERNSAQTERLASLYVKAGLLLPNEPIEGGAPLTRSERAEALSDSHVGLKPLAAAIFMEDEPLTRFLLAHGASQDLGTVYAGEPPMTAMQLATEEGAGAIHALLVEDQLKRGLAQVAAPTPSQASEPAPRRRRMSV